MTEERANMLNLKARAERYHSFCSLLREKVPDVDAILRISVACCDVFAQGRTAGGNKKEVQSLLLE